MRLPFIELLELEQRVALVAAIIRRLQEMDLLSETVTDHNPTEIAREVIGITDFDATERWAVVNATIAVGAKALDAAAIITSELAAPAMAKLADRADRMARKLAKRRSPAHVRTVTSKIGPDTGEVSAID